MRIRSFVAFVVLAMCVVGRSAEDTQPLTFDGKLAKEYIAYLSSDAMEGRMTGTEGYRRAADWAAAKFKEWGLQPAGADGTFFQNVELRGFDWNTGVPELIVGTRAFLFDDRDFTVESGSSPGVSIKGEVVFVGYGIAAPAKGLNEYGSIDVKGKVVLAFKGSPKDAPEARRPFERSADGGQEEKKGEETDWTEESKDVTKIKAAYEQGAAGILLFDPDESTEGNTSQRRSFRGARGEAFSPERDFLSFSITERVFRAMMRPDPQESSRGLKRRMDGIRREIQRKQPQSRGTGVVVAMKGFDQSVRYDKEHGNDTGRNVLAKIEGTDPALKDQCVIVGAHLDHVGVRNGYVYNGADDNASGSAVVLELARVFAQAGFKPRRTLLFACWCGEEQGLLGSLHYTKNPCDGVSMDKMVGCFNLDMVGMGDKLGASGALNFPSIWEVIKRDQDPELMKRVEPSTGGPGGSDHTGFVTRGIESVFLMSSGGVGHQDYHQPEDDIDKIEPEMLRIAGQFTLQGMVNLADETAVNLLVDRRLERYQALRMRVANSNPSLKDSSWSLVDLKAASKDALFDQTLEQVRTLLKTPPPAAETRPSFPRGRRGASPESSSQRPKKSIVRGIANMELIGTDTRLLDLVIDVYGVGRVDIHPDNAAWIQQDSLTEDGKAMLKMLEERGVVVRLVSPRGALLGDVLSAATKPFVVTGDYEIPDDLAERLNSSGVLFGVNLDPKVVPEFIDRVEKIKSQLGERKNLFAYLTGAEGLDDAKTALYLGLIDKGWAHNEIVGGREHGGLMGGASLNALGQ